MAVEIASAVFWIIGIAGIIFGSGGLIYYAIEFWRLR